MKKLISINSFMYNLCDYILEILKNIIFKKLLSNFRTKANCIWTLHTDPRHTIGINGKNRTSNFVLIIIISLVKFIWDNIIFYLSYLIILFTKFKFLHFLYGRNRNGKYSTDGNSVTFWNFGLMDWKYWIFLVLLLKAIKLLIKHAISTFLKLIWPCGLLYYFSYVCLFFHKFWFSNW